MFNSLNNRLRRMSMEIQTRMRLTFSRVASWCESPLRKAALMSIALHGAVLIPLWITHPASCDVARGAARFEIQALSTGQAGAWSPPGRPSTAARVVALPSLEPHGTSREGEGAASVAGAFIAARPHGT